MAAKVFFSYAHEDEALLNKLKAHLMPCNARALLMYAMIEILPQEQNGKARSTNN
jgi:hypothetical protein